jgi:pyridoxamine 5'-phosphate oxidase
VRVQGSIKKIREEQSDTYFASRPRESQIGAWASFQSQKLTSRNELQERFDELNIQYAGQDIPRPPHWGGYVLVPNLIEFWQGRSSRLHDRIVFERSSNVDLVWDCYRKNP